MAWWWLVSWAMAGPHPCADLPEVPGDLGRPPNHWPAYDGRCLDRGPATETLAERARRCTAEEPEDPGPIALLGFLGDDRDVPLLEALALRGLNPDEAARALGHLGTEPARAALVRVACHAPGRRHAAIAALAIDPRPEEWPLYAEDVEKDTTVTRALGSLSLPEGRRVLMSPVSQGKAVSGWVARGLAMDLSEEGVQAFLSLRDHPNGPAEVLRAVRPEHPAFDRLVAEARTSDEPQVRRALLDKLHALGHRAATAVVKDGLDHEQVEIRRFTATGLAREDGFRRLHRRAASNDDPARAVAYHGARSATDARSLRALQALRDEPSVRWEATEALLRKVDALPDKERKALLAEVLADPEAPASVVRHAKRYADEDAATPKPSETLTIPPLDLRLSRDRVPVADAERWRARARAALTDHDLSNNDLALAVLPWVGDDSDARFFRHIRRLPALAALATPSALEELAARIEYPTLWSWTRTERGWQELTATATHVGHLRGLVRADVYEAMRQLHNAHPDVSEYSEWEAVPAGGTAREQREAMAHYLGPQPTAPTPGWVATLDHRALGIAIRHIGHRWWVLAELDTLEPGMRAWALQRLARAPWRTLPPQVVVDAARADSSQQAWTLRLQVGDTSQAIEAMQQRSPEGDTALWAVLEAVGEPDPPPELLEAVRSDLLGGRFPQGLLDRAAAIPALESTVRDALLAGRLPGAPCVGLRWVGTLDLDDDWVVEQLLSCPGPRPKVPRDRVLGVQRLLLARVSTDAQLCTALNLDHTDAEVVRPHVRNDDACVRQAVWATLRKAPVPDSLVPWLIERAIDGNQQAMQALAANAPRKAVELLAERIAFADDRHAAGLLVGIGTDEAMVALVPLLERGTYTRRDEVAHWLRRHGGAPYDDHRALVDALLVTTWTTTP